MKNKLSKILVFASALTLIGCGETISASSVDSVNSNSSAVTSAASTSNQPLNPSSDIYSEVSTSEYEPSYNSVEDAKYQIKDYKERLEFFINNVNTMRTFSYAKRGYVKPYSDTSTGTNEYSQTDYTYYNGPMLIGKSKYRSVTGVEDYTINEDSGYTYDVQGYVEDGYLMYVEKLPRGVISRVSYTDVSKNNRYNNLYTIYSTTRHLRQAIDALSAINGEYSKWSAYDIQTPTITTVNGQVVLNMTATREDSGYGAGEDYFKVSIDEQTGALTSIVYGFKVFNPELPVISPQYYSSIAEYTVNNISYGGRTDYDGKLYSEVDVDKNYGLSRQAIVDYSSFPEGILSDDLATKICSNIQAYAVGTTKSEITFDIPKFVDSQEGYYGIDDDGEYLVHGELYGQCTAQLYKNDFLDITGKINYEGEDAVPNQTDVGFEKQVSLSDEGALVIEKYNSILETHKHTVEASDISDVDHFLGVNGVFLDDAYYPMKVISQIGINCEGNSVKDDEFNEYTSSGTVTKEGNKLIGKIDKVYVRNVWTPYRTFSVDFVIEDNFLTEYSFTEETYLETDTAKYTFPNNTYSFKNYREVLTDFTGEVFIAKEYPESEVEERRESLYM